MIKKAVNINMIIERFGLEITNKDAHPINRDVLSPAIKRVGLELTGQIKNARISHNVICWGTTESKWFVSIGKDKSIEALDSIFRYHPPIVILSRGVSSLPAKWIIETANKYKIPVCILPNSSTAVITTTIGSYLNNFYLEETQVHGCLVLIGGVGVLIVGPSGSGKSEATLDLIQRGHIFIADDAVLIKDTGGHFVGSSPKITRNFLEVRGIGIIDIKYTYGITSVARNCEINLVVELVQKQHQNDLDRIGIGFLKYPINKTYIKKIQIPVKDGGSTASLIEAAVSSYLARHDGLDVIKEITERSKK
ncbi:HPr(Ser) kinase/phosphatase [Mycoplasmopsis alligatoris]|uniref:HPr(Ser) kinase/phosphatase n=1 Tax=Mycoplasmopsis alligatoris A21JP2 TaxID=747682 RepID=D4XVF4_9BACT|nr:HPr(Ser) kinase/phosphatase [Mycoplasmopsis alligatoris]EFF41623.1 HPr(Ser) kinase/phosphatase [Mycoplasmopsis alligatoris A21JP2]